MKNNNKKKRLTANLSFKTDLQRACLCAWGWTGADGTGGADTQNGNHISHCMYNGSLRVKWPI